MSRIAGHFARIGALAVAGCVACDYFGDMLTPTDLSRSSCRVLLVDTAVTPAVPVAQARIEADGQVAVSGTDGWARLESIRTGRQSARVRAAPFRVEVVELDVTLDGCVDTIALARREVPPDIDTFYATPSPVYAYDDTVLFLFSVYDSVWPISRIRLEFGDGQDSVRILPGTSGPVLGRVHHRYPAGGDFTARLTVHSTRGDSSSASVQVSVAPNRKPVLSVTFPPPGVFYDSWPGSIMVSASDPDGDFRYYVIDWGDGTSSEVYASTQGQYPHVYTLDSGQTSVTHWLTVDAFDSTGASRSFRAPIRVTAVPPLVVGPQVTFRRAQTLGPGDTTVSVGITVLGTGGHVSEVSWRVNMTQLTHTQTFDSLTGAVAPGGSYYEHTFPIAALPDTNQVRIRVRDSYGLTREPYGYFYIIGR